MLSLNGNMCTIVHMLTRRDTIVHMLSQLLFHLFPLRARSRSTRVKTGLHPGSTRVETGLKPGCTIPYHHPRSAARVKPGSNPG